MMSKWTIKQLNEHDDFTFAMCILSERSARLNPNAPLTKKLQSAFCAIEELRDICRENSDFVNGIISAKEAIFRREQHDYLLEDLKKHMSDDSYDSADCLEKHGLTIEAVMADKVMMCRIIELFHKHDGEGKYWDILDLAVMQGIKDTLVARKNHK